MKVFAYGPTWADAAVHELVLGAFMGTATC